MNDSCPNFDSKWVKNAKTVKKLFDRFLADGFLAIESKTAGVTRLTYLYQNMQDFMKNSKLISFLLQLKKQPSYRYEKPRLWDENCCFFYVVTVFGH